MAKRKPKPFDGEKPAKKKRSVKRSKKRPKNAKKSYDDRPRLQRVMASAGIGSRRECELIIEEGRVEVDGEIVTKLGIKVDPDKQEIMVDAQEIVIQGMQYFILNKPPGVVSTSKDPSGRARVIDLIKTDNRVYNVGRLDKASEGLILVTNDGDLANRLTHPRYGIEKKYLIQVAGVPEPSELRQLEKGVYLAEGLAKATRCKFVKKAKNGCWLELVLAEGRNREIRRMLASIGHKVRTLKRISIGPLKLGDLPVGAHRRLFPNELRSLRKAAMGEDQKKRSTTKSVGRKSDSDDSESGEIESNRPSRGRKVIGRSPGKSPGRSAGGGSSRSAGGSAGRSTGKSPSRSASGTSGRSSSTSSRSAGTGRSAGGTSGRSAGKSPSRSPGGTSGRSASSSSRSSGTGRSAGDTSSRSAGKSPSRSPGSASSRSSSKPGSATRSSSKSRKPSASGTRGANKGTKMGTSKSGKPVRSKSSGVSAKGKPKRGKRR